MTTWAETTKTGVTEVGVYLTLSTADSDILLLNTSGDYLELNESKTLSGETSWTLESKS